MGEEQLAAAQREAASLRRWVLALCEAGSRSDAARAQAEAAERELARLRGEAAAALAPGAAAPAEGGSSEMLAGGDEERRASALGGAPNGGDSLQAAMEAAVGEASGGWHQVQ